MPLGAFRLNSLSKVLSLREFPGFSDGVYFYDTNTGYTTSSMPGKSTQVISGSSDGFVYGATVFRDFANDINYVYDWQFDEYTNEIEFGSLSTLASSSDINSNFLFPEQYYNTYNGVSVDQTNYAVINIDNGTKSWHILSTDGSGNFTVGSEVTTPGISVGTGGEPKDMVYVGETYNNEPTYIFMGRGSNFRLFTRNNFSFTEEVNSDFGSGSQRMSIAGAFPGFGAGSAIRYDGFRQDRKLSAITFENNGNWYGTNDVTLTSVREGNIMTVNDSPSTYCIAYGRDSSDGNLPLIAELHRIDFTDGDDPTGTVLNKINFTGTTQTNERESQIVRGFIENEAFLFYINDDNPDDLNMVKLTVANDTLSAGTSQVVASITGLAQFDAAGVFINGRKYFVGSYFDSNNEIHNFVVRVVGSEF